MTAPGTRFTVCVTLQTRNYHGDQNCVHYVALVITGTYRYVLLCKSYEILRGLQASEPRDPFHKVLEALRTRNYLQSVCRVKYAHVTLRTLYETGPRKTSVTPKRNRKDSIFLACCFLWEWTASYQDTKWHRYWHCQQLIVKLI